MKIFFLCQHLLDSDESPGPGPEPKQTKFPFLQRQKPSQSSGSGLSVSVLLINDGCDGRSPLTAHFIERKKHQTLTERQEVSKRESLQTDKPTCLSLRNTYLCSDKTPVVSDFVSD